MFTDIVNSAPIAAALGDRVWSGMIAEHFADLQNVIEGHQGQFVKSLGDGTMSTFASALQGLEAAQEIQRLLARKSREPRLNPRIGLHTGDVVQSENDFFGTVVNKAARIAAVAGGGQILLSDVTHAIIGDAPGLRFIDEVEVTLKGLEGQHRTFQLDWREQND